MILSTMPAKTRNLLSRLLSVFVLLLLWEGAALLLHEPLLLPSPVQVLIRLFTLWREPGAAGRILKSFFPIAGGFFSGLLTGALLAVLSGRFPLIKTLLAPLMLTVKTVPVASFIILALVWLSAGRLSGFISFLMVLPVIYNNFLGGIQSCDPKLAEMSRVFSVPPLRRLLYVRLPQMKEAILTGAGLSLGLAWKAGIAAEVIGIPAGTIGEALYESKAYLNTTDLFAWTVIIVLLSFLFEKAVLGLIRLFYRKLEASV